MRNQNKVDKFRRDYANAEIPLNRKILAGKRRRLSLEQIALALEIPLEEVEKEWGYILQDGR